MTCRRGCVELNPRRPESQRASQGLSGVKHFWLGSRIRRIYRTQTLEHTSFLKCLPNVSSATYFTSRRPASTGDMIDPPSQVDGNYKMGEMPHAGPHGQDAPAE